MGCLECKSVSYFAQRMNDKFTSLKGQLLLDSGGMGGSFFMHTVVLVCEHTTDGAFGLVLNKQSERTVGEVFLVDLPERLREQGLYVGGPVQEGALSYLHSDDFLPDANVMPNVSLSHSMEEMEEMADSFSKSQKLRVFVGYSGWGAGQLDDEMKRKSWLTHPASVDHVFLPDPSKLWRRIMLEKGGVHRLMADAPDDLSWN